jgi:hypothetical protein
METRSRSRSQLSPRERCSGTSRPPSKVVDVAGATAPIYFAAFERVRFLHFLCTPCGQPGPQLPHITRRITHASESRPSTHALVHKRFLLLHENRRRSATGFFLNCTKNTDLTAGRFNRTFSFAFTEIKLLSSPARLVDCSQSVGPATTNASQVRAHEIAGMEDIPHSFPR